MRNLWCSKVKLTIPWSSGIYPCIIFTGLWSLVDLVELPPITLIYFTFCRWCRNMKELLFSDWDVWLEVQKDQVRKTWSTHYTTTNYTVMQLYFVTWGLCVFAPCIDCLHHFLMLMFLLVLIFFCFRTVFSVAMYWWNAKSWPQSFVLWCSTTGG